MTVRAAPQAPLGFRDDGTPDCPACAVKLRAEREAIVLAATSVGTSRGVSTSDAIRGYLLHYHRSDHQPPVTLEAALATITLWIESHRYTFGHEHELRDGIVSVLDKAGLAPDVEHRLDKKSRLDVYLPVPGVAVEVKCKRAPDLWEQLRRYADHPRVHAVVLVTTILSHGPSMPHDLAGTPLFVVQLAHRGL